MSPEHIFVADGGGSGCRVSLIDRQGTTLATLRGGAANIGSDYPSAQKNLLHAIEEVYHMAGLPQKQRQRDFALFGLAGDGEGASARQLAKALGFGKTHIVSDIDIAVEGALGDGNGFVVGLGTGSFFVARHEGATTRIGGWGPQLGDECSGVWLGLAALRATLHAHDRLIDHSPLTSGILARFKGSPREIVRFARSATSADMARFAPDIAKANRQGDPVATEIMGQGVHLLCQRIDALSELSGGVDMSCYLLGGLAPIYEPLLPQNYRSLCHKPAGSALDGAASLAFKHLIAADSVSLSYPASNRS